MFPFISTFKQSNRGILSATIRRSFSLQEKKVVFLGTPKVAADSLQQLHEHAKEYKIVGVVTQPPTIARRNSKKIVRSPVHDLAERLQLPVFTPETAKDVSFLEELEKLNVDLFITAAYGNYLPKRFLNISKHGTINIHPSLLPKYRGAAPIQRCLENGDPITGVSVLFSVMKMDAGPIIKQIPVELNGDEKAPALLEHCFRLGTQALIQDILPTLFQNGSVSTITQKDEDATLAPKLDAQESVMDPSVLTARQIHNKGRGFADWPGIFMYLKYNGEEYHRVKIVTTIIISDATKSAVGSSYEMPLQKLPNRKEEVLVVTCADGSQIGIYELLPAGKKLMNAKSFMNGIRTAVEWQKPLPPTNETTTETSSSFNH
jgi:methionyl-tRNA formyltransferase